MRTRTLTLAATLVVAAQTGAGAYNLETLAERLRIAEDKA